MEGRDLPFCENYYRSYSHQKHFRYRRADENKKTTFSSIQVITTFRPIKLLITDIGTINKLEKLITRDLKRISNE